MKLNWLHTALLLAITELVFWLTGFAVVNYLTFNYPEFRIEKPIYVFVLLGIRGVILLYALAKWTAHRRLKKYASGEALVKFTKRFSSWKQTIKFTFLLYGISFLIIAWANPQFGKDEKKMNTSGIDIMVCLDVSNSMLAKDLSGNMNRLEVAKLALKSMFRQLDGDRVGVIVFAGSAYSYIPITNDYEYIKLELLSINPGMMSAQGTALGAAIETAMSAFDENKTNKAIILFTDGENHEDNAQKAAKAAREKGVKVYTVGMGTNKAVPIPKSDNRNDFHKDKNGNTVLTKLNELMLKDLAKSGNGLYEKANKTSVNTAKIIEDIDKLEKTKFKERTFLEYEDRFQWPLAIGFLLLIINSLIGKVF